MCKRDRIFPRICAQIVDKADFACYNREDSNHDSNRPPGPYRRAMTRDGGNHIMKISDVIDILSAEVVWGDAALCDREVQNACGSDLMSDVLAYVKDQSLLLTGLVNPQVIRTAEMMDFVCIVFVRGKRPDPAMIELASEYGIVLLTTRHRMFTACGRLYAAGLEGGSL